MNNNSKQIIISLSEKVKAYRIDYPMTQNELADKTGVSVRSIQNFEKGNDIQLSNFIKILKGLDLVDNIDMLVPDVSKRPSMYLKEGKKRLRASKTNNNEDWVFKWGDEE